MLCPHSTTKRASMGEIQIREKEMREKEEEEAEAEMDIYKYIFGFVEIAVIKCAIDLNIADAMESHKSPMTLSQLSSTLNCDPSMLYRIMRFLTHRNIFKQITAVHGCPAYTHTALSRLLIKNSERSRAALVALVTSPVMLAPCQSLSARVLVNGTSWFEKAHGEDVWSYAAANAEHSELINEAMACDARRSMREMVEQCGEAFEGVSSVADVGGGNGTAMKVLARASPRLRCINFDLPHVVSAAPKWDGVEHVAGDMFVSVPKADAAFLMWVLHDWGDEECIQILKKCKEAIPHEKGRVIIAEAVIEEGSKEDKLKAVGLMTDIMMMAYTTGGKERTLKEWEYVINEAGFSRFTVKNIRSVKSVIMAFP